MDSSLAQNAARPRRATRPAIVWTAQVSASFPKLCLRKDWMTPARQLFSYSPFRLSISLFRLLTLLAALSGRLGEATSRLHSVPSAPPSLFRLGSLRCPWRLAMPIQHPSTRDGQEPHLGVAAPHPERPGHT